MSYNPTPTVKALLDWCLERVKKVPYGVTLRWIFYRAVQEKGLVKEDYGNFTKFLSKARKRFYNGWTPYTLKDDTREESKRGSGYSSGEAWLNSFVNDSCFLDKLPSQDNIVLVMFEAAAMSNQFAHYLGPMHISTYPFRGDASIEYKWRISQQIKELDEEYNKPIIVLYFGDYDKKGLEIPENARRDIQAWSGVNFEWRRMGLNEEHIDKYNILENPKKPGDYQWEALDEKAAEEVILGSLDDIWDLEAIEEVERVEDLYTKKWLEMLEKLKEFEED